MNTARITTAALQWNRQGERRHHRRVRPPTSRPGRAAPATMN